jgi:hypothetical protein
MTIGCMINELEKEFEQLENYIKKAVDRQIKIKNIVKSLEMLGERALPDIHEYSKMGRPLGSYKYSNEEINFLKANKETPMKELIKKFNEKFNKNFNSDTRALYNMMQRQNIIRTKIKASAIDKAIDDFDKQEGEPEKKEYIQFENKIFGRKPKYPKEMLSFVRENINSMTNDELVEELNKKFKVDINYAKLGGYMAWNKIKRERKTNRWLYPRGRK